MNIIAHRLVIASVLIGVCLAQKPPYLKRPVGFPVIEEPSTESNVLGNRFGNGETTTTQRLPVEALGDRELVNRLSKLPLDNQPFWLINWQALEEHRKQGHTYQHNPSNFINGAAMFNRQF